MENVFPIEICEHICYFAHKENLKDVCTELKTHVKPYEVYDLARVHLNDNVLHWKDDITFNPVYYEDIMNEHLWKQHIILTFKEFLYDYQKLAEIVIKESEIQNKIFERWFVSENFNVFAQHAHGDNFFSLRNLAERINDYYISDQVSNYVDAYMLLELSKFYSSKLS